MLPSVYIFPSVNNFRVYQFLAARIISEGKDIQLCNVNSESYIAGETIRRAAIKKNHEEVLEQMNVSLKRNKQLQWH